MNKYFISILSILFVCPAITSAHAAEEKASWSPAHSTWFNTAFRDEKGAIDDSLTAMGCEEFNENLRKAPNADATIRKVFEDPLFTNTIIRITDKSQVQPFLTNLWLFFANVEKPEQVTAKTLYDNLEPVLIGTVPDEVYDELLRSSTDPAKQKLGAECHKALHPQNHPQSPQDMATLKHVREEVLGRVYKSFGDDVRTFAALVEQTIKTNPEAFALIRKKLSCNLFLDATLMRPYPKDKSRTKASSRDRKKFALDLLNLYSRANVREMILGMDLDGDIEALKLLLESHRQESQERYHQKSSLADVKTENPIFRLKDGQIEYGFLPIEEGKDRLEFTGVEIPVPVISLDRSNNGAEAQALQEKVAADPQIPFGIIVSRADVVNIVREIRDNKAAVETILKSDPPTARNILAALPLEDLERLRDRNELWPLVQPIAIDAISINDVVARNSKGGNESLNPLRHAVPPVAESVLAYLPNDLLSLLHTQKEELKLQDITSEKVEKTIKLINDYQAIKNRHAIAEPIENGNLLNPLNLINGIRNAAIYVQEQVNVVNEYAAMLQETPPSIDRVLLNLPMEFLERLHDYLQTPPSISLPVVLFDQPPIRAGEHQLHDLRMIGLRSLYEGFKVFKGPNPGNLADAATQKRERQQRIVKDLFLTSKASKTKLTLPTILSSFTEAFDRGMVAQQQTLQNHEVFQLIGRERFITYSRCVLVEGMDLQPSPKLAGDCATLKTYMLGNLDAAQNLTPAEFTSLENLAFDILKAGIELGSIPENMSLPVRPSREEGHLLGKLDYRPIKSDEDKIKADTRLQLLATVFQQSVKEDVARKKKAKQALIDAGKQKAKQALTDGLLAYSMADNARRAKNNLDSKLEDVANQLKNSRAEQIIKDFRKELEDKKLRTCTVPKKLSKPAPSPTTDVEIETEPQITIEIKGPGPTEPPARPPGRVEDEDGWEVVLPGTGTNTDDTNLDSTETKKRKTETRVEEKEEEDKGSLDFPTDPRFQSWIDRLDKVQYDATRFAGKERLGVPVPGDGKGKKPGMISTKMLLKKDRNGYNLLQIAVKQGKLNVVSNLLPFYKALGYLGERTGNSWFGSGQTAADLAQVYRDLFSEKAEIERLFRVLDQKDPIKKSDSDLKRDVETLMNPKAHANHKLSILMAAAKEEATPAAAQNHLDFFNRSNGPGYVSEYKYDPENMPFTSITRLKELHPLRKNKQIVDGLTQEFEKACQQGDYYLALALLNFLRNNVNPATLTALYETGIKTGLSLGKYLKKRKVPQAVKDGLNAQINELKELSFLGEKVKRTNLDGNEQKREAAIKNKYNLLEAIESVDEDTKEEKEREEKHVVAPVQPQTPDRFSYEMSSDPIENDLLRLLENIEAGHVSVKASEKTKWMEWNDIIPDVWVTKFLPKLLVFDIDHKGADILSSKELKKTDAQGRDLLRLAYEKGYVKAARILRPLYRYYQLTNATHSELRERVLEKEHKETRQKLKEELKTVEERIRVLEGQGELKEPESGELKRLQEEKTFKEKRLDYIPLTRDDFKNPRDYESYVYAGRRFTKDTWAKATGSERKTDNSSFGQLFSGFVSHQLGKRTEGKKAEVPEEYKAFKAKHKRKNEYFKAITSQLLKEYDSKVNQKLIRKFELVVSLLDDPSLKRPVDTEGFVFIRRHLLEQTDEDGNNLLQVAITQAWELAVSDPELLLKANEVIRQLLSLYLHYGLLDKRPEIVKKARDTVQQLEKIFAGRVLGEGDRSLELKNISISEDLQRKAAIQLGQAKTARDRLINIASKFSGTSTSAELKDASQKIHSLLEKLLKTQVSEFEFGKHIPQQISDIENLLVDPANPTVKVYQSYLNKIEAAIRTGDLMAFMAIHKLFKIATSADDEHLDRDALDGRILSLMATFDGSSRTKQEQESEEIHGQFEETGISLLALAKELNDVERVELLTAFYTLTGKKTEYDTLKKVLRKLNISNSYANRLIEARGAFNEAELLENVVTEINHGNTGRQIEDRLVGIDSNKVSTSIPGRYLALIKASKDNQQALKRIAKLYTFERDNFDFINSYEGTAHQLRRMRELLEVPEPRVGFGLTFAANVEPLVDLAIKLGDVDRVKFLMTFYETAGIGKEFNIDERLETAKKTLRENFFKYVKGNRFEQQPAIDLAQSRLQAMSAVLTTPLKTIQTEVNDSKGLFDHPPGNIGEAEWNKANYDHAIRLAERRFPDAERARMLQFVKPKGTDIEEGEDDLWKLVYEIQNLSAAVGENKRDDDEKGFVHVAPDAKNLASLDEKRAKLSEYANKVDQNGKTLLHLAIEMSDKYMHRKLIEAMQCLPGEKTKLHAFTMEQQEVFATEILKKACSDSYELKSPDLKRQDLKAPLFDQPYAVQSIAPYCEQSKRHAKDLLDEIRVHSKQAIHNTAMDLLETGAEIRSGVRTQGLSPLFQTALTAELKLNDTVNKIGLTNNSMKQAKHEFGSVVRELEAAQRRVSTQLAYLRGENVPKWYSPWYYTCKNCRQTTARAEIELVQARRELRLLENTNRDRIAGFKDQLHVANTELKAAKAEFKTQIDEFDTGLDSLAQELGKLVPPETKGTLREPSVIDRLETDLVEYHGILPRSASNELKVETKIPDSNNAGVMSTVTGAARGLVTGFGNAALGAGTTLMGAGTSLVGTGASYLGAGATALGNWWYGPPVYILENGGEEKKSPEPHTPPPPQVDEESGLGGAGAGGSAGAGAGPDAGGAGAGGSNSSSNPPPSNTPSRWSLGNFQLPSFGMGGIGNWFGGGEPENGPALPI